MTCADHITDVDNRVAFFFQLFNLFHTVRDAVTRVLEHRQVVQRNIGARPRILRGRKVVDVRAIKDRDLVAVDEAERRLVVPTQEVTKGALGAHVLHDGGVLELAVLAVELILLGGPVQTPEAAVVVERVVGALEVVRQGHVVAQLVEHHVADQTISDVLVALFAVHVLERQRQTGPILVEAMAQEAEGALAQRDARLAELRGQRVQIGHAARGGRSLV